MLWENALSSLYASPISLVSFSSDKGGIVPKTNSEGQDRSLCKHCVTFFPLKA